MTVQITIERADGKGGAGFAATDATLGGIAGALYREIVRRMQDPDEDGTVTRKLIDLAGIVDFFRDADDDSHTVTEQRKLIERIFYQGEEEM